MLNNSYKKVVVDANGNKYDSYKTIQYVHESPTSENSSNLQINNNKAIMTINSLELTGGATATTEDIVVTRSGKNLFDKSLAYLRVGYDLANCTLIATTENGWIVKGNDYTQNGSNSYRNGWFSPLHYEYDHSRGIYLNEGDIVTVSADYTVLENPYPNSSYPANIYLSGDKDQTPSLSKLPPLNITKRRNKTFTISKSGRYYPKFTLNSATIKIENIQVEIDGTATTYEPYLSPKSLTFSRDYLLSLKGVNNLFDKNTFYATGTKAGVTFTNNGDGTITVNGTATATSFLNFGEPLSHNVVIGGHKALIRGCPKNNSGGNIIFGLFNQGNDNLEEYGGGKIGTVNGSLGLFWGVAWHGTPTFDNLVFKPELYDLTAIYGEGNEPTTVEQFLKDYPLSSTDNLTITKNSVKYNDTDITSEVTGLDEFMKTDTNTAIIDTNYAMGSISADVDYLYTSRKTEFYTEEV